jgi:hypothetical protein
MVMHANSRFSIARANASARAWRTALRTGLSGCLLASLALIGACSGTPRRQGSDEELQRYMAYAGEPVSSFSLFGGLDNWQSLSRDKIVVWTKPNDAYMVTVQQPCSDLSFAQRIGVTSTGTTVNKGLDFVTARHQKCTILEIRPVNYRRMQEDARQKKQASQST